LLTINRKLKKSKKAPKKSVAVKPKKSAKAVDIDPVVCRKLQLESLLSWKYSVKNPVKNLTDPKAGEYISHELENLMKVNLNEYAEDLEVILINPPWSNTHPVFNFNSLVSNYK